MIKDAVGNELKKGDWILILESGDSNILGCISEISRWNIVIFTTDSWGDYDEFIFRREESENFLKIISLKSTKLVNQYLTICEANSFKKFVSRHKKIYTPLILIDSPFCGL